MNSRSCEVIRIAPGYDFRNCSSQMIDSMSRWLVGSSISSTSGRPSSTRASATRIFQPPDNAPASPSIWSLSGGWKMRVALADEGIMLENSTALLEPLLAKAGVLSKRAPTELELKNIEYGRGVARRLAE